jgi:hypothetical protein
MASLTTGDGWGFDASQCSLQGPWVDRLILLLARKL